jgi:arylsulfatase A
LYGAARETTPFLSALAKESVTYTQARAPSNWSLPSHVSLFTGLEAHEHKVTVHDGLSSGNTVFEELSEDGYATGVFSENGFLTGHEVGIRDCFETVVSAPDTFEGRYNTTSINPGPDGFHYADQLLEWTARRDHPWAACLNLMDAHRPFEPRIEYDRWGDERARNLQYALDTRWEWTFHGGDRPYWQLAGLESLHDGGIRQTDAVLEMTIRGLQEQGRLDETLVVVCGDHGDGFGEPGHISGEPPAVSHIIPMHEELLHVPLVVRPPGGTDRERIHDLAALTQFPSVVREHVRGDPVEHGFATERVLAKKQPVTADLRDRFERHCDAVDTYLAPSRAVYTNTENKAVKKRYHWGEKGLTELIHCAGAVETLDHSDPPEIDSEFGGDEAGIREPLEGAQATDEVKDQLAAIGYY